MASQVGPAGIKTPRAPPVSPPPLRDPLTGELQTEARKKATTLQRLFFPDPLPADLADIQDYCYPEPLEGNPDITPAELREAILKPAQDKAPGPDSIPHRILRLLFEEMEECLRELFTTCLHHSHHPECFRNATTVALRKLAKPDYREPKVWCPIALLNTLGKALETIVAQWLRYIAKKHKLLPATQHGCHRQRDTTTALELLTEQVHTTWGQGRDKVATLLSLDMAAVFPNMSHNQLLHNLHHNSVLSALLQWTTSFLAD